MPHYLVPYWDYALIFTWLLVINVAMLGYNVTYFIISAAVSAALVAMVIFRTTNRNKIYQEERQGYLEFSKYLNTGALDRLGTSLVALSHEGTIIWYNQAFTKVINDEPDLKESPSITTYWKEFSVDDYWGRNGELDYQLNGYHYQVRYETSGDFMIFYADDVTELKKVIADREAKKTVLCSISIDNYEEVMKGISDSEKSQIVYEVERRLEEWIGKLDGTLIKTGSDSYTAIFANVQLPNAKQDKFAVLDKVVEVVNTKKIPVTLSMGVAVSSVYTIKELMNKAEELLELSEARGGAQVSLSVEGKIEFFGGKAQAMEKNTRVKVRVMSQSIVQHIKKANTVFIMGHANEDFDAIGAAVGMSRLVREEGKPCYIVLSDISTSSDKYVSLLMKDEKFREILLHRQDVHDHSLQNALLIVVDTHIQNTFAMPELADMIENVIVIDHHRRGEDYFKNTLLTYQEPSQSSTSEIVTELLQYYPKDIILDHLEATGLYAGILLDTKNFLVQTGARTFDASSYLRRSGLDPILVRELFRTDYNTELLKARIKATAKLYDETGLLTGFLEEITPHNQVIASQVADEMLRTDKVRASIVVYQLKEGVVGVSSRAAAGVNVQLIMEHFGGGGHQGAAATQIKGRHLIEVYDEIRTYANNFIRENAAAAVGG